VSFVFPRPLVERAFHALEHHGGYVVLKNPDPWESLARGGDIDLVVPDKREALAAIVDICGTPRLVVQRDYVTAVYFQWGELDLVSRVGWRGRRLLSFDEVRRRAIRTPDDVLVAAPAHEAIGAWIMPLLHSRRWSEKYAAVVAHAFDADGGELRRVLRTAFGSGLAARLEASALADPPEAASALVPALRRRLTIRSVAQRPAATVRAAAEHTLRELVLRARPPLPHVVVSSDAEIDAAVSWAVRNGVFVSGIAFVESLPEVAAVGRTATVDVVRERLAAPRRARPSLRAAVRARTLRARCCLTVSRGGRDVTASSDVTQTLERHVMRFTNSALAGTRS
jgi:hypothetical protein